MMCSCMNSVRVRVCVQVLAACLLLSRAKEITATQKANKKQQSASFARSDEQQMRAKLMPRPPPQDVGQLRAAVDELVSVGQRRGEGHKLDLVTAEALGAGGQGVELQGWGGRRSENTHSHTQTHTLAL